MTIYRAFWMTALVVLLATPAWSQGTLFVEGDNVGIGTASPTVPLDIDATGGSSNLVRLVRDGAIRYRMFNTSLGVKWDFNNDNNGNFAVSRVGTGGPELTINVAGRMGLGCGGADHDFVISPGPGCSNTPRSWIDAGSTSFSTSSSRTLKENLSSVEFEGILDKIQAVPVYEYDFIDGPKDHIGVMAEDFHQIFQRGSDKELSGHEMTMALWLAVQELSARVEQLQASRDGDCHSSEGH
ncbi:MAG: tail fiber domain-containing protein [bacterium]